ncbi:MAG: DUF6512 family protein [Acutalibacteraceae bacterium]|nr:hypothetical protein [Clostridia bacterium]MEE3403897.1 DUF6512 family protein [Acutalibacteraceae bacterium]HCA54729.1 hypothetical protein [Oscillospiraceae bacterium]
MQKEWIFWSSIVGFFVVSLLGTAAHDWYGLSGQHPVVSFLAPTDESVFQHLKLLFFPFLLYTFGEFCLFGRKRKGFFLQRMIGLLWGLAAIPVIYYSYTLFTGHSIIAVDILLFYFSVGLSFYISASRLLKRPA